MKSSWEFSHPGVFVKDFDKTLDYFNDLGISVEASRSRAPGVSPAEMTQKILVFGKLRPPPDPNARRYLELIYIGDLEYEILLAPAERPQGDSLAYGEGINHVCFNVPDIDAETDRLAGKGLPIIFDLTRDGVRFEDYLDTREYGNVILSMRPMPGEEAKKRRAAVEKKVDWKFRGHNIVVKDLDKTVEYYKSMEIVDFEPEVVFDSSAIADIEIYGKSLDSPIKARTRAAKIGPIEYNVIQPVEGKGIYAESLERRGEGIIDLVFDVDNLEKETARLTDKGVPVIFSGNLAQGGSFACFDTREHGGDILITLVQ